MRKSTKNAIVAFVAILLALAIVIACGVGSSWFTNGDIATWFNSWGKGEQTEQPDEETPEEGGENGAVLEESESNGVALMSAKIATADYEAYGVSPLADTAYTLTATITPSDATNKAVTYSVAWKNASSAWASGKTVTDYVTVTQATTGSLTATVTCLQPFGEQVIVTCVVTDNVDLKATCTVDYFRKLTGLGLDITCSNSGSLMAYDTLTWSFDPENSDISVDFPLLKNVGGFDQGWVFVMCDYSAAGGEGTSNTAKYETYFSSAYTIKGDLAPYVNYSIAITQEYYDVLSDLGFSLTCSPEEYKYIGNNSKLPMSIGNIMLSTWVREDSETYGDSLSYSKYVSLRSALKDLAGTPMFRLRIQMTNISGDLESTCVQDYNVSFSASSFANILAEDISLDDTSIVF